MNKIASTGLLLAAMAGFPFTARADEHDGLIVGVDAASVPVKIRRNGVWADLTGNVSAWGMAADNNACTLWISSGFTLFRYTRGDTVPTQIADFTYDDGSGAPPFRFTLSGLAWANGHLFGSRSPGSIDVPEGIFEVDTSTGVSNLIWACPTSFDMGGLDADQTTGILYATSDPASGGFPFEPQGLYRINLNGPNSTATRLTDYRPLSQWPGRANTADVDGLGIGNGRAYMVIDEPGDIAIWNLATGAYEANIAAPWTTSNIFSSAAWAPCFNQARCVADFDDGSGTGTPDGGVGIEDLLYYLIIYNQGVLAADVDDGSGTGTHDSGVGIEDLLYFLTRYGAGC